MKIMISIILVSSLLILGCSKEQKIIFEAESIEYKQENSLWTSEIQQECNSISEKLTPYIEKGWRVVASSPKQKIIYRDKGVCVGTEYILEK